MQRGIQPPEQHRFETPANLRAFFYRGTDTEALRGLVSLDA